MKGIIITATGILVLCMIILGAACSRAPTPTPTPATMTTVSLTPLEQARAKIKHVVIIMQENRSFDSYFGTFPGADGIPMENGVPTVCSPDPLTNQCVAPYHDPSLLNAGGPHAMEDVTNCINGGKMDGFVALQREACKTAPSPDCGRVTDMPDVMGYHDAREIPNYWNYAREFVLQDRMFAPARSWSLPIHLFTVSGWSAVCTTLGDPMSCVNELMFPNFPPDVGQKQPDGTAKRPIYAWTDITYLLHKENVSWAYYVAEGTEPECEDPTEPCIPSLTLPGPPGPGTPGIWNPLPWFDTVRENDELGNIPTLSHFYEAARTGTLPAVSWIAPDGYSSEHPYWQSAISNGESYVTSLINTIMEGPEWDSTAIFLVWDDWGGFYDHVIPPQVDENGYGLRVPGLLISPYAKKGYIDHQVLSFDAYLKFIEDLFLNGQRLDPQTDGRPDPRPTVRENTPGLGDLLNEFDFSQPARPPVILPAYPPPGPLPG